MHPALSFLIPFFFFFSGEGMPLGRITGFNSHRSIFYWPPSFFPSFEVGFNPSVFGTEYFVICAVLSCPELP